MGFEIPLDIDYFDHPKAMRLVAIIGKRADVFPLRLFAWAAKFAKEGHIPTPEQIEHACRWDGKPGVLHAALIECGFLEPDGATIHDWMDRAGGKIAAYRRKKDRQTKEYRRKNAGIIPAEFPHSAAVVLNTTRNDTKQHENKKHDTASSEEEISISALAEKAAFDEGWGTDPKRITLWHKQLSRLHESGKTLAFLINAIDESPDTESPWDFGKRMDAQENTVESEADRNSAMLEKVRRERKAMEAGQ